jgi:hypothetical protein
MNKGLNFNILAVEYPGYGIYTEEEVASSSKGPSE